MLEKELTVKKKTRKEHQTTLYIFNKHWCTVPEICETSISTTELRRIINIQDCSKRCEIVSIQNSNAAVLIEGGKGMRVNVCGRFLHFLEELLQFCKVYGLQMRPIFIWMAMLMSRMCICTGHRKPVRNIGEPIILIKMHCFCSWYCWNNFSWKYFKLSQSGFLKDRLMFTETIHTHFENWNTKC